MDIDSIIVILRVIPTVISLVREIGSCICNIARDIINDLEELKEKGVHRIKQVKLAVEDVKRLVDKGFMYIDKVDDIFYLWQGLNMQELHGEIQRGDLSAVTSSVEKLQTNLSECEQLYQEFGEQARQTQKSTLSAAIECEKLGREAKSKKEAAQVVGGVTSAGIIATGVATSIVAGIFTFGIGTVVGLAVTGATVAGTATAGAVAAGATVLLAERYSEVAKTFRKIGSRFRDLDEISQDLNNKIDTLKHSLDDFAETVDTLDMSAWISQKEKEQIYSCLYKLHDKGKEYYKISSKTRNEVKSIKEQL